MSILYIILGLVAFAALYVWRLYNKLVSFKIRVKEAFSDIDIQLKRRNDLIPNLIETVKGYMKHEKDLLENIVKLREQISTETDPKKISDLDSKMSQAIKGINIKVENYPDLKANTNFLELQKELTSTEDKISYSRRFYNQAVQAYNTVIGIFPNSYFAKMFNFHPESFFEATEEERENIKVDFN